MERISVSKIGLFHLNCKSFFTGEETSSPLVGRDGKRLSKLWWRTSSITYHKLNCSPPGLLRFGSLCASRIRSAGMSRTKGEIGC